MLRASIATMMDALAQSSGLYKGRVKLDSKPSGLVASVDGVKIGVTPLERDLDAGAHEIEIVKDGTTAGKQSITVEPDHTQDIVIDTRPPAPIKPKEVVVTRTVTVHERSRVWPALLIGAGLAAGAGGGVLLYYGQKGGPNDPYIYPKATNEGLALAIGGGGMVLAGILVAVFGGSSSSAPSAEVAPGHAILGWAGSF
jgi:hypothetical protein